MKAAKIILLALVGLSMSLYSCNNNDMHTELSQEDLLALNGLRDAYLSAFNANAELKLAVQQADDDSIHFYDSVFHHFEGLFEKYHNNYSHANAYDDHHHDEEGMYIGADAMNMHSNEDGHHDDDHDLMNDLMTDHETVEY